MRIDESQNALVVRPLLERWREIAHGDEFGLEITVDGWVQDLAGRLEMGDGTLLVAYDGIELVGFFAVFATKSSVSDQQVAVETFWFAIPNHRLAGPALFRAAQAWATTKGCTHLIVSASRLASDLHDKVCGFCEKVGMKPFETVYIAPLDVKGV